MYTLSAHISRGAAFTAALAVATCAAATFPSHAASTGGRAYGWPVKPFHRQHPIRGGFGDPRTVFDGPPTTDGLMTDAGSFQFHFGVDISADDGTAVYPVVSGTVTKRHDDWIAVDTGDGRIFQYFHIAPAVGVGQKVETYSTLLGTILPKSGHVHLTEIDDHQPVNPLQPGHLTPYTDRTKPAVDDITFRARDGAADVLPGFVRGSVEPVAEAYDTPSLPVHGSWHGMPVAPALVTWHIETLGGRIVVPERVAVDFRRTIPDDSQFWSYYARGTYQNMAVFKPHYSWAQPGRFLFKLTRTPFDTRVLADGVYVLVVTAADIRGNRAFASQRLTIHNRLGWRG